MSTKWYYPPKWPDKWSNLYILLPRYLERYDDETDELERVPDPSQPMDRTCVGSFRSYDQAAAEAQRLGLVDPYITVRDTYDRVTMSRRRWATQRGR